MKEPCKFCCNSGVVVRLGPNGYVFKPCICPAGKSKAALDWDGRPIHPDDVIPEAVQ